MSEKKRKLPTPESGEAIDETAAATETESTSLGKSQGRKQRAIRPVKKKVGEEADNLRQRGEWFQQRSGAKKTK